MVVVSASITDATASYGGYSGAPPNEKITWGKLGVNTPKFNVHSDATIVLPLYVRLLVLDRWRHRLPKVLKGSSTTFSP